MHANGKQFLALISHQPGCSYRQYALATFIRKQTQITRETTSFIQQTVTFEMNENIVASLNSNLLTISQEIVNHISGISLRSYLLAEEP